MIKHYLKIALAIGLYFCLAGDLSGQRQELIIVNKDLQLVPLTENLYIHISWLENAEYGRFSSNGIVYVQNGEALLVDTPMKEELTKNLVAYIQNTLHAKVSLAIPGHFHDDCIGGLPYLHSIGVHSLAGKRTTALCRKEDLVVPQKSFNRKKTLRFQGRQVMLRYFGPGHAPDNIVVWFPEERVLFGGCLIRALAATDLGNTSDAIREQWGPTVAKIQHAFPMVETVIPGHGPMGDAALLQHTIDLVESQ